MNGRYLLDTNIVIGLLENEPGLTQAVAAAPIVFLSAVVVGELYFGAAKSGRSAANRKRLEQFLDGRVVLPCDLRAGVDYGLLKHALRVKGTPLPENDVWIAAIALSHSVTLVTRDHHFSAVPSLSLFDGANRPVSPVRTSSANPTARCAGRPRP